MQFLRFFVLLFCFQVVAQNQQPTVEIIMRSALENKNKNDPRQALGSFQFDTYEKTVITDSLGSSTHNFFSEKVSAITYTQKQAFSEKIIGYQLAGFKKPRYEIFAVNLQSRSFYDDDFVIFNTRYAGILSDRGLRNYDYELKERAPNGDFVIAFTPKKPKTIPGLVGSMVLDQNTFAIKNVSVSIKDAMNILLYQEYTYLDALGLYVPINRDLFIDKGSSTRQLSFFKGKISVGALQNEIMENMVSKKYLVSTLRISNFQSKGQQEIAPSPYAIVFAPDAHKQTPAFWTNYRAETLTTKDQRSFSEIEKIVNAENIERRLGTINNFSVGYFSVSAFDFDLTYPVKFNNYEGLRLGMGGVTNAAFSKRFRLEGYGAYGFKDKAFKFGLGGGYLVAPKKDAWLSVTYNDDLEEVGNYAYLTDRRVYSLFEPRLVNINLFYTHRTLRSNFEYRLSPKVLTELQVAHRKIYQTTDYRYLLDGTEISDYDVTEATLGFRWSATSKFMNSSDGIKEIYDGYPKVTAQISQGFDSAGGDFNFTKVGAKIFYRLDRLNKSATEILLEGNIGFGDLPITHLFHAFPNAPTKETILQRFSVAGVNSFETMFFGEFFSDQLFTAQIKHRLRPFNFGKKFKPEMVFISRFAIGDIRNPQDHLDIEFGSLRKGFTETGFEINKLIFGFGTSLTYRYGGYHLPNWEDNIAFKFTFNLQL
jgi:hypothetical protein